MSGAMKGLQQLLDVANPSNLKALKGAGAVGHASGAIALVRTLPWLFGRGPSLGIVSQMHRFALGDKPAIHDRNGTLTWSELDLRANQMASALQDAGVGSGDRVAAVLRNGREFVEVAIGTQKAGMVSCPLNTFAKPKELAETLANTRAKILFYDTAHAEQIRKADIEDLPLVFTGDPSRAVEGSISFDAFVEAKSEDPPAPFTRSAGTPRIIIQTSGTTGTPRGASRDAAAAGLGALANLIKVVPYHRDDIILIPTPMFHSFGLVSLSIAAGLGATMVLPHKFDPRETLSLIETHRVTALSLVPVMIRRILSLPDEVKSRYDLSSLRIILASGSAMGQDLRREATELFGEVLYDLYGSTEAGWVSIATPEDIKKHPLSVGKPSPGIDVAIFSSDGNKVPPGQTGEIYVKSKYVFEGYTSGDAKDQRQGYMAIGDLGRLDTENYLYVESRADDMVIIGGENVYPIEVEDAITSIAGVNDAAVVGVEDEEYGQILVAFVEGDVAPDVVQKTCEEELASYKVPKRVEVLQELPRTGTGKVLKRELISQMDGAEPLEEDG
jgi:fatty-acyl-CoA synthase